MDNATHGQTAGDGGPNGSDCSSEDLPGESASWQGAPDSVHGSIGLGFALWPPTPSTSGPATEAGPVSSSSPRPRSPSVSSTEMGTATPVDLEIPALSRMPSVTIADSPLGRLSSSAGVSPSRVGEVRPSSTRQERTADLRALRQSPSRPRSFLSSMLGRASRSGRSSAPASPELQAETAIPHGRSSSMPVSAGPPEPRSSSDLWRAGSPSPRSFAARTFANLTRSASVRGNAARPPLAETAAEGGGRNTPSQRLYGDEMSRPRSPGVNSSGLAETGLALQTITPALSYARHAEPLCGAVLDDRYLLIGTSSGLDFLPLPVSDPLLADATSKKRRTTRKPLSLIKRTRFKDIVLLSERSNILVAIAGRNDHVRVYALDSIRQLIRKRMQEIDADQGYPIASVADTTPSSASRTARAARDAGLPKPPPVQISPKARSQHVDPVRTVGIRDHVAQPSEASRRELRTRASRDFIAGRRPSASGATTPSTRSRAGPAFASSRRSSIAFGQVTDIPALDDLTQRPLRSPSTDTRTSPRPLLEPRAPLRLLNASERSSTSCLAEFLRDTGPGTLSPELDRLFAESMTMLPGDRRREQSTYPASGSPEYSGAESSLANDASASAARRRSSDDPDYGPAHETLGRSIDNLQAYAESSWPGLETWQTGPHAPPATTGSSQTRLEHVGTDSLALPATSARSRKRWTFNGFTTSASPADELALAAGDRTTPSPSEQVEPITADPSRRHDTACGFVTRDYAVDTREQVSPTRDQLSPTLRKRRSVCSLPDATGRRVYERYDRHAANLHSTESSSTLEFLKLARSRNARLIRAIETRKKTYLAILGGEEGDHIELYTGSKQISLSLNRTFVLPDAPRTVELQLQGDDLVDIYLVYADSIFALEPATVRVREVGIGRDECRPRRQRTRSEEASPAFTEEDQPQISPQATGRDSAIDDPPSYPPESRGNVLRPRRDFSAFQQLAFIPPVPSNILAASWTIPPLYTDVVGNDELPLIADLLSPISLLSGAALRNNGRPGLFFCSTGACSTAIVTAEGRNVIKWPVRWNAASLPEEHEVDFARHRLETLVLGGAKTVVIRIASESVQLADFAGLGAEDGFVPASAIPAPTRARFRHLATHAAGEQLFFVEATTSSFVIKCLHGTQSSALP